MEKPDIETALVKWTPALAFGIKSIDEQHRGLLDFTNDLFRHCVGNDATEREYFKKVIDGAVDYVKTHFSTEEELMQKYHYPDFAAHKKEHTSFVFAVVKEANAYATGKESRLLDFARYLKEWILNHIAVSDKKYVPFFKQTDPALFI
jgi:hemerythrin